MVTSLQNPHVRFLLSSIGWSVIISEKGWKVTLSCYLNVLSEQLFHYNVCKALSFGRRSKPYKEASVAPTAGLAADFSTADLAAAEAPVFKPRITTVREQKKEAEEQEKKAVEMISSENKSKRDDDKEEEIKIKAKAQEAVSNEADEALLKAKKLQKQSSPKGGVETVEAEPSLKSSWSAGIYF